MSDAPLCPGTGNAPDELGELVMTTQSGRTFGLCGDCTQWTYTHRGRYLPHGQQPNDTAGRNSA